MTVVPLVSPRYQSPPKSDGTVNAGGLVYFYTAGTLTPKNTYTDSTGVTPNANPVVLDATGTAAIWGSGSYKVFVKTSAGVTIDTDDNYTAFSTSATSSFADDVFSITDNSDPTKIITFQASGLTTGQTVVLAPPTASGTISTVKGATYSVATGTANAQVIAPTPAITAYAAGDAQSFLPVASNTSGTVTITTSGLATRNIKKFIGGSVVILAVGDLIINQPAYLLDDGTQYILMNPQTYTQGADVASATTTNLDTATGDYVNITGTTTITGITLSQGRQATVKFAGILTFTHGSNLILPGAASITTAAGDTAILRGEASGVVRCIMYQRASGTASNDSTYRTLCQGYGIITAGTVAGTYSYTIGNLNGNVSGGAGSGAPIGFYIAAADFPTVGALTTKLRLRVECYTNDVAPTGNFTWGLYPFTRPGTSGGASTTIITIGTVVSGSDGATFTAPAADGLLSAVGSDFAIPSDGHYCLAVLTTATAAASSHTGFRFTLQMRNT